MRNIGLLLVLLFASCLAANETATVVTQNGLRFSSEGFELNLKTQVLLRLTIQDERGNTGSGSRATNGRDFGNYRVAAARAWMTGHIFDPNFQYVFRVDFAKPASDRIELAFLRWTLLPVLNINAGQHKLRWNWEEFVPPDRLAFAERSYANAIFNQNFAKGVWIDGEFTRYLRYSAGIYNGVLRGQDDFRNRDGQLTQDAFGALIDNDIMLNLRLETHPLGEISPSIKDMRSEEERHEFLVAAGIAANWMTSGVTNADLRGDTGAVATGSGRSRVAQGTLALTLDAHARWHGASLDVAVFWRHTQFQNKGINRFDVSNKQAIGELDDLGWSIEAGYHFGFVPVTVGVRYSGLNADEFWGNDATLSGTTTRSRGIMPDAAELGVTGSYYLFGERLKASLDILYVSQQLTFAYDSGNRLRGVYNEPPARRGTVGSSPEFADYNVLWIVRLQLQWIF